MNITRTQAQEYITTMYKFAHAQSIHIHALALTFMFFIIQWGRWVAGEVVSCAEVTERAELLAHIIRIATVLFFSLGNNL